MDGEEDTSLEKNTTKGVGYLGAATVLGNVIRLLALALLSRQLTAADFGIATLAMVVSRFGQESAAFGLETTIVQRKTLSGEEINNCFWAGLLAASMLWTGYLLFSPIVANAMKMPQLAPALIVASIVILTTCLGIVPRSLLERRLEYGKVAGFEVLGQGLGDLSSVALAFSGFGLWSLIGGFIVGDTIKTIGFWLGTQWRPRLHNISIRNLQVWRFGSYVTADRILTYFSLNGDRLVIGNIFGAAAVGYYSLAFELIAFPAKRFSALVGRVLFSSLSRIQDQSETNADFYLKTLRHVSLFTLPALVGLAVVADEVSQIIYGPMAPMIGTLVQILCPAGIVFAVLTPSGSLLYSQGRPDLSFRWSALTLMVVLISVSLGSMGGIAWAAAAVSAAWLLLFPVMLAIVAHVTQQPWLRPYKVLSNTILAGVLVGGTTLIVKHGIAMFVRVSHSGLYFSLLSQIVAGTIAFGLYIWVIDKPVFDKILSIIHERKSARRQS